MGIGPNPGANRHWRETSNEMQCDRQENIWSKKVRKHNIMRTRKTLPRLNDVHRTTIKFTGVGVD